MLSHLVDQGVNTFFVRHLSQFLSVSLLSGFLDGLLSSLFGFLGGVLCGMFRVVVVVMVLGRLGILLHDGFGLGFLFLEIMLGLFDGCTGLDGDGCDFLSLVLNVVGGFLDIGVNSEEVESQLFVLTTLLLEAGLGSGKSGLLGDQSTTSLLVHGHGTIVFNRNDLEGSSIDRDLFINGGLVSAENFEGTTEFTKLIVLVVDLALLRLNLSLSRDEIGSNVSDNEGCNNGERCYLIHFYI
jgi:hypothetical protein